MNDTSGGNFEDRLRAALVERAGLLSAPPDGAGMSHVAARARLRHTRRRWEAATLAVVVVMAVHFGLGVEHAGLDVAGLDDRRMGGPGRAGGHRGCRENGSGQQGGGNGLQHGGVLFQLKSRGCRSDGRVRRSCLATLVAAR